MHERGRRRQWIYNGLKVFEIELLCRSWESPGSWFMNIVAEERSRGRRMKRNNTGESKKKAVELKCDTKLWEYCDYSPGSYSYFLWTLWWLIYSESNDLVICMEPNSVYLIVLYQEAQMEYNYLLIGRGRADWHKAALFSRLQLITMLCIFSVYHLSFWCVCVCVNVIPCWHIPHTTWDPVRPMDNNTFYILF